MVCFWPHLFSYKNSFSTLFSSPSMFHWPKIPFVKLFSIFGSRTSNSILFWLLFYEQKKCSKTVASQSSLTGIAGVMCYYIVYSVLLLIVYWRSRSCINGLWGQLPTAIFIIKNHVFDSERWKESIKTAQMWNAHRTHVQWYSFIECSDRTYRDSHPEQYQVFS